MDASISDTRRATCKCPEVRICDECERQYLRYTLTLTRDPIRCAVCRSEYQNLTMKLIDTFVSFSCANCTLTVYHVIALIFIHLAILILSILFLVACICEIPNNTHTHFVAGVLLVLCVGVSYVFTSSTTRNGNLIVDLKTMADFPIITDTSSGIAVVLLYGVYSCLRYVDAGEHSVVTYGFFTTVMCITVLFIRRIIVQTTRRVPVDYMSASALVLTMFIMPHFVGIAFDIWAGEGELDSDALGFILICAMHSCLYIVRVIGNALMIHCFVGNLVPGDAGLLPGVVTTAILDTYRIQSVIHITQLRYVEVRLGWICLLLVWVITNLTLRMYDMSGILHDLWLHPSDDIVFEINGNETPKLVSGIYPCVSYFGNTDEDHVGLHISAQCTVKSRALVNHQEATEVRRTRNRRRTGSVSA